MKRLLTIMSALLITAGLKAQNSTVKKETSKPVAEINTSAKAAKQAAIKKTAAIKKADAGFKNAEIKKVEIKKAAVAADKAAPAKQ